MKSDAAGFCGRCWRSLSVRRFPTPMAVSITHGRFPEPPRSCYFSTRREDPALPSVARSLLTLPTVSLIAVLEGLIELPRAPAGQTGACRPMLNGINADRRNTIGVPGRSSYELVLALRCSDQLRYRMVSDLATTERHASRSWLPDERTCQCRGPPCARPSDLPEPPAERGGRFGGSDSANRTGATVPRDHLEPAGRDRCRAD